MPRQYFDIDDLDAEHTGPTAWDDLCSRARAVADLDAFVSAEARAAVDRLPWGEHSFIREAAGERARKDAERAWHDVRGIPWRSPRPAVPVTAVDDSW